MTEKVFLKKGTVVKVRGIKKAPTDVVLDLNEGINAILKAENVKTLAELNEKLGGVEACCIQACDCCLQISKPPRAKELQYV